MSAIGPIAEPAPGCKPAPPPVLTEEQQSKYEQLLSEVKSWESLPKTSKNDAESGPLDDNERLWLTRECLLRYLRATKWNLPNAITRLRSTAIWRREFGTESFTSEYISPENEKGKQVQLGYDKEGRPCLYLLPQNQNTKPSQKQVEHLVYMLERTLDLHPPGQEGLALLIDFRNTGAGGTPPMGIARQVLDILQNHYPERLGRALLTHLPWYVTAFLKLIGPFIDPVTKTKIKYNEPLIDHVPASQLMAAAGGEVDFKYDHSIYWPALAKLAAERRAARVARWEEAGKLIGESEIYLWGGDEESIGAKEKVADENTNGKTEAEAVETEKKVDAQASEANGTTKAVETELVDGVENLDIKQGEPVKAAA